MDRDPNYAEWKIWAWRTVRGAAWTGIVAVSLVWNTVDLTDWNNALKIVVVSFLAGFGQAIFRGLREKFGDQVVIKDVPVLTKLPL